MLSITLAGGGSENFEFEAIPDPNHPDLSLRLCRIRLFRIGEGLPCIQLADPKSKEVYSKSNVTSKEYDDYGKIEIGLMCPVNYPYGKTNSNKLTAQLVYEVPQGSGILDMTSKGIIHNEDTLVIHSGSFIKSFF